MTFLIKKKNIIFKEISKNSIKVLYRLNKLGYKAYLVGGSIRDILLKNIPKDFDISTDATPHELRKIFKNCRLIGRRFIIVHLIFPKEIIEVSTFRTHPNIKKKKKYNSQKKHTNGMLLQDNKYGKIEEDVYRRDITINALYYNIKDFCIYDYVGGLNDIKKKIIRLIGHAETRYREDPVIMLRVIRFSAHLNMNITKKTSEPLERLSHLLKNVPVPRLFNESIKLFCSGYGYQTYKKLKKYSLIQHLLPIIFLNVRKKYQKFSKKIRKEAFKRNDYKILYNSQYNPSFLFSALLWYLLVDTIQKNIEKKKISYDQAYYFSVKKILKKSSALLGIPKNLLIYISKIWSYQKDIENLYFIKKKNIIFFYALELFNLRIIIEKNSNLKKILQQWKIKNKS
ncbi:polynucleotide adenylyltransferase PcnB [Buchnera aphidicola]|uniref:Poly(A) polymerase I, partial n=1 Tax=Buchnera aphidicola subsp. Tuberolachnus salignus TaxID=98804 RepID=A0A160SVV9_BUCTT|nr:polynucleotide adenylyltransferase PcnB [Buchnera aphidicola]CUR53117.1 Poly(A) polymerase I [Buchnera aphidicola (Tuberolachnus salignus)]